MTILTSNEAVAIQLGLIARALAIITAKRKDYSGAEDPFRNLRLCKGLGVDPELGVLVRITDKLSRISTLYDQDDMSGEVGESLEDTLADIINYTAILTGLLCERNEKMKVNLLHASNDLPSVLDYVIGGSRTTIKDDRAKVSTNASNGW